MCHSKYAGRKHSLPNMKFKPHSVAFEKMRPSFLPQTSNTHPPQPFREHSPRSKRICHQPFLCHQASSPNTSSSIRLSSQAIHTCYLISASADGPSLHKPTHECAHLWHLCPLGEGKERVDRRSPFPLWTAVLFPSVMVCGAASGHATCQVDTLLFHLSVVFKLNQ